jgi:hypothetical protein
MHSYFFYVMEIVYAEVDDDKGSHVAEEGQLLGKEGLKFMQFPTKTLQSAVNKVVISEPCWETF